MGLPFDLEVRLLIDLDRGGSEEPGSFGLAPLLPPPQWQWPCAEVVMVSGVFHGRTPPIGLQRAGLHAPGCWSKRGSRWSRLIPRISDKEEVFLREVVRLEV